MREARITPADVRDCLSYLGKVVGGSNGGQLKFHRDTETRSQHIAHRLHAASTFLFSLIIFGIAGDWAAMSRKISSYYARTATINSITRAETRTKVRTSDPRRYHLLTTGVVLSRDAET